MDITPLGCDVNLFSDLLRHDEGLRVRVYDDATGQTIGPGYTLVGQPTIGYGRNVGPTGPGLRQSEIDAMLMNDINYYEQQAETFDWYKSLDPVRATVICCMIFNLGLRGFSQFKNLHAALAAGNWSTAADEMLNSLWARQVGDRAHRLSEMMRTGVPIQR